MAYLSVENGVVVKAQSVIFPDGYKKCTEIEGFPWICAVRSCRLTYKTARGLGRHFRVSSSLDEYLSLHY